MQFCFSGAFTALAVISRLPADFATAIAIEVGGGVRRVSQDRALQDEVSQRSVVQDDIAAVRREHVAGHVGYGSGCPSDIAPAAFSNWICSPGEPLCADFRNSALFEKPWRVVEAASRLGKQGYLPDTSRLKRVISKAALENRPLEIAVFGGSMTNGRGCKRRKWTQVLEQLSNLPASPLRLKVRNLAMQGSSLVRLIPSIAAANQNSVADIVILDSTLNDPYSNRHGENQSEAMQELLAVIEGLASQPALLSNELLPPDVATKVVHGWSSLNPCAYTDMANNTHWLPLKSLRSPMLSYVDVACELYSREARDGAGRPSWWWTPIPKGDIHPGCGLHSYTAHVVMQYLVGLQHEVCTGPGFAAAAAAPVSLHSFSGLVQEKQRCWLNQKSLLGGGSKFPAADPTDGWEYKEDVPGKPGWIARKGEARTIFFDVQVCLGLVSIEYLSTYKDVGRADCWIDGEKSGKSKATIDARWKHNFSLSSVRTLYTAQRDQQCGPRRVACQSKGMKFKLISITSC